MKEKLIQVQVTPDTYISTYLSLFYGSLHLTNREQKVLEMIIDSYVKLKDKVEEPYLTELILSTDRRKEICKEAKLSSAHLNNLIKGLKEKGIFLDKEELEIDPRLIPSNNIRFEFYIQEEIIDTNDTEELDETIPTVDKSGLLDTEVKLKEESHEES